MDKRNVAITVVDIVDHDAATGVLVKFGPDNFVLIVAAEIEEIDTDLLTFYLQLFDTIVYANGRYVTFDEASFAVSLDQATLAGFLVADRDNLEERMGWLWHFE